MVTLQVIPSRPINAVTLRVQQGKSVLIGGLASITLVEVSDATAHSLPVVASITRVK